MSRHRLIDKQHRWLSLVEISGVVLSEPVLVDAAPTGFRALEKPELAGFYKAKDTWSLPPGMLSDPQSFWTEFVLGKVLELIPKYWQIGADISKEFTLDLPAYGEFLRPTRVLMDGTEPVMLFLQLPQGQGLDAPWSSTGSWKASPTTKIDRLLRSTNVEVALITNGEAWRLIVASPSETMAHMTWTATTWADSPSTLAAFKELLGASRFFAGPRSGTILALVQQSRVRQVEVADKLGDQVLEALDSFIHELDRVDAEFDCKLLNEYSEEEIYEAAAVFMMRLLFLFYAEENQLFPHGQVAYDQSYGVIHLLNQLENAYRLDPSSLSSTFDAYARLLALFRLTHQGSSDPDIHINPYGGQLFDADRFMLLEGKNKKGGICEFTPPPVSNSVVRHVLRSLKYVQETSFKQWVSYRSLAVEQIGYMYEGLLDFRLARNTNPETIFLLDGKDPFTVPFLTLTESSDLSNDELIEKLGRITGKTKSTITKLLEPKAHKNPRFPLTQPHGDPAIQKALEKLLRLLKTNAIVRPGGLYLVPGEDRKASGTHYTPPILTEPIVRKTLEPLCVSDEGFAKSAKQLLDLKICDMTMGSGAFLVQAIRYLSAKLMDAWDLAITAQPGIPLTMPFATPSTGAVVEHLMPGSGPNTQSDYDSRKEMEVAAKRYVAQHCIYGVDKNHLAVEMAKLSLWLETLALDQPFTFLDHALKCGDSLLGVNRELAIKAIASPQGSIFAVDLQPIVDGVITLRANIADSPVHTTRDLKANASKLNQADQGVELLKLAADISLAAFLNTANSREREVFLAHWNSKLQQAAKDWLLQRNNKKAEQGASLQELILDCQTLLEGMQPFHWPFEFPEVFLDKQRNGMDAFIGNPPFVNGMRISTRLGNKNLAFLKNKYPKSGMTTDLCAYFFLEAFELLSEGGILGMLATNTIAQGDTRSCALETILSNGGQIFWTIPSFTWPGKASLEVAIVGISKGNWSRDRFIGDSKVENISSFLRSENEFTPARLKACKDLCFAGTYVLGLGFTMSPDDAKRLIQRDPKNANVLFRYLNGDDLNSRLNQEPSRFVINFSDWPLNRVSKEIWLGSAKSQQELWAKEGLVAPDYAGPVAADYPDCLDIVRNKVKPQRDILTRDTRRIRWWQFAERSPGLYKAISPFKHVFAACKVTKYVIIAELPSDMIFDIATIVFATDRFCDFALYQSSLHEAWVRRYASTMKKDIRYSHTDCVETFPRPSNVNLTDCEEIGNILITKRADCMQARKIGLTSFYNLFHDAACKDSDIAAVRDISVEVDRRVLQAYGWTDQELHYSFQGADYQRRFTFSPQEQQELLQRLTDLNKSLA